MSDAAEDALRRGLQADPLSAEAMNRIRAATQAQWQASLQSAPQPRLWKRYAGIAAILVLGVGASVAYLAGRSGDPALVVLGKLQRANYPGVIELRRWRPDRVLQDQEQLHGGQHLLIRGGARVALSDGASLRLAAGTAVEVLSDRLLRLTDGSMYLDVPPGSAPRPLAIRTPAGTFEHVGTQFQIALRDGQTSVEVREGRIRWHSDAGDQFADAGTRLLIDRAGKVLRTRVASSGTAWGWVESLAGAFDIEGRSLIDFLRYTARETGRAVVFSDAAVERRTAATTLHGSTHELAPLAALSAVMSTTTLRFTLDAVSIRIESAGEPQTGK